ncbi:MAG: VWA domain-containing protein [Burkholderiales bacterium]|nr:VWA domain-containing protein [Burkholderiales bacterium]
MSFVWPQYLWLLLIVPVLVAAYIAVLRRKKAALRYANVGMVKQAIGPAQRFRRHVPPLLFLLALIGALLAVARPSALVTLPTDARTVIMAMDVSLSMRATDVDPNRIIAAQNAAKHFVQDLPQDIRAGIVTFAGTALLVQPPTQNREDLVAAIDRFQLQRHTAIGSGMLVALATLFPDDGIDVEQALFGYGWGSRETARKKDDKPVKEKKPPKEVKPVPPGSHKSAAIVLLTDGRRTMGPDPMDVARMAASRGVRIFTVGFGSASGGSVDIDGMSIYMRFDEETLKQIAGLTQAEYFHAKDADSLKKVYESLNKTFALERKQTEISALFAAAAALLAVVSAVLSLLWFNRLL